MHSLNMVDGWHANFNGDFSGDVRIVQASDELPLSKPIVDIKVPFEILKCIVAEYVRREKTSKLENATDDEVLGLE